MLHVTSSLFLCLCRAPPDVVKIIGCRVQQPVLMPLVVSLFNRFIPPQQRDVLRTRRNAKAESEGTIRATVVKFGNTCKYIYTHILQFRGHHYDSVA